jgi:hypothetical protein
MGKEIVQVSCHPFLCDLVSAGDISKGKVMWLILLTIAQVHCTVGLDINGRDDCYYFSVSTQKDYDYIVSSISCQALLKGAACGAPFNDMIFGLYAFASLVLTPHVLAIF